MKEYLIKSEQIKYNFIKDQVIITFENTTSQFLILYTLEGQGTAFYDGNFLGIKQDDLLIVDLTKDFYYSSNYLNILSVIVSGIIPSLLLHNDYKFSISNRRTIINLINKIGACDESNQVHFVKTYTEFLEELSGSENKYTIKMNEDPINSAIRFIEENFNQSITVDKVASEINFSKYHFIRKFKEYTKKTPYQYIIELRMEHSKYLLTSTNKNIKEVASLSGFKSEISYMNTFKSHVKVSPTTYRKKKEV